MPSTIITAAGAAEARAEVRVAAPVDPGARAAVAPAEAGAVRAVAAPVDPGVVATVADIGTSIGVGGVGRRVDPQAVRPVDIRAARRAAGVPAADRAVALAAAPTTTRLA